MSPPHAHLPNAPVSHAIFDLRATTDRAYGLIPGALFPAIEAIFPTYAELPGARVVSLMPALANPILAHSFKNEANGRVVNVGPQFLAIHLQDYVSWSDFRGTLASVVEPYIRASQATSVSRIALRYVNTLPPGATVLHGVAATVQWPEIEHFALSSVAARGVFAVAAPPGEMGIAFSGESTGETKLDLDFWSQPGAPMDLNEILSWADAAHDRIYEAFERMITSEAHDSFRSGKGG